MAVTPRLELRQSQSLVMTPQLQQAIKLLQLSNLELSEFVDQELERNPLLERADTGADGGGMDANADASETGAAPEAIETRPDSALDLASDRPEAQAPELDADFTNVFNNDSPGDVADDGRIAGGSEPLYPDRGGSSRFENGDFSLEHTLSEDATLHEHLLRQLYMETTDPAERLIGAYLVGLVDDAGYIALDEAEAAATLGCEAAQILALLSRLQSFEPTGVCARSLQECLGLQLKERDRLDPAMAMMLEHLDLVARREFAALSRLCGVDTEDIADMLSELKSLDPKPGQAFGSEVAQTLVPDIYVRAGADGVYHIELNNDTLPRVLVNKRYYTRVLGSALSKDEKTYVTDCLNSANWLIKSLDQRANTILKVASELVRQQESFFRLGIRHLRPLNLRTIADAISMHESTVSRVTANKYIATPRGTFEMKYFFTSAIASSAGGEAHSAEAVRDRIRELIEAESVDEILSDDRLVEILMTSGVDIARRTVAKYREAMRIPSSVMRRRLKRAG